MHRLPARHGESVVEDALARLRTGRGLGLLVIGAHGSGRTTFATAVRERSRAVATCAWAAATDEALPDWLLVWRELAEQIGVLRPGGPADRLATWLAQRRPVADRHLVDRVCSAFEAEAAAAPVALFIDDVPLLDSVSARIVDGLFDAAHRVPVLMAVVLDTETERAPGPTAATPWREWREHPRTTVVELGPLPDPDIRSLIRRTVPTAVAAGAEDTIVRAARGNPRLARELATWEAFAQTSTRTPSAGHLVTDSLARRLVIACEHETTLATLATAGRPVSASLLARALVHPPGTVAEVLDRAAAAGVVVTEGDAERPLVLFSHSFFAEIARALPGPERMLRVRASLAQALTEADARDLEGWTPPEIASHFVGVGDHSDTAMDRCLHAARWCEAQGDTGEAIDFATYALLGRPTPAARHSLLGVLGRCAERQGDRPTATRALSEAVATARTQGGAALFAEAVADLAAVNRSAGATDPTRADLIGLLHTALDSDLSDSPSTAARLRAAAAEALHLHDFPTARTLADQARRLVAEHPQACRRVASHVLATGAWIHGTPEGWDQAFRLIRDAPAPDSPTALRRMIPATTGLSLARGDAARLEALESGFAELLEAVPDVRARQELDFLRATRALLSGDQDTLTRALRSLPTPLSEEERMMPSAMAITWTAHTGRALGIEPTVIRPPSELPSALAELWASTQSVVTAAPGDTTARLRMKVLAEVFREKGPARRGPTWAHEMAVRAQTATLARDTDLGREVCDALAPYTDEFAVFSSYLPIAPIGWLVADPLRRLGDFEAAYEANARAEEVSRRLEARWWIARCLLQRARLLGRQKSAQVTRALDEATRIARELDSARLFEEAARLRSDVEATTGRGVRTPARLVLEQRHRHGSFAQAEPGSAQPGPGSLTSRELDVLRLAAAGMTNAGISEALHLSVSTVERHCTNIYRKLNVRNRAQALGVLAGWETSPGS